MASQLDSQDVTGGRRWIAPLVWGVGAAVAAFAAAAVGLSTSGVQLTPWQYLWTAVAALVPGIVAASEASAMGRQAERQREAIADLRGQVHDLVDELHQREEDDEAERGTTAVTLSQLGATLAQVVTGACLGDQQETREAASRFARVVIEALYEVLDTGRQRGPLRLLLLAHRGGHAHGLDDPLPKSGGHPVVFTAKWAVGHRATVAWDIRQGAQDAYTAERIMAQEPPWVDGALLIDDVAKPEYSGGHCVLLPPDEGVASYCRVAVTDEQRDHGILCIDSWQPGALTVADEAVAQSFAVLLAAGLTVAATLPSGEVRRPSDAADEDVTGDASGRRVK